MALGTAESTKVKDQVDFTLKASQVPNTATLGLVNISTHIPASGTDTVIKTNATMESGFLPGFINIV
jgi:hypothetical protein